MSSSNSKRNNKSRKSAQSSKLSRQMDALLTLNQQQVVNTLPARPDIPPMLLSTHKIWTMVETQFIAQAKLIPQVTPLFSSSVFALSNSANAVHYEGLFDSWRIAYVEVVFIPVGNIPSASCPQLYTCIDYDDGGAPTTLTSIAEHDTCQISGCSELVTRRFNPRLSFNTNIVGGGNAVSIAPLNTWVSTNAPSAQYNSIKFALTAVTTGLTYPIYTGTCKIVYQFKGLY